MAYFFVYSGLRGCYMPDTTAVIRCDTRRELKAALEWEARDMKDAYGFGGSKREVSRVAAMAWRNRKRTTLDYVVPFGRKKGDYPFGLFVSAATRDEYLEHCREND